MTTLFEGSIIRCFRRLSELLLQLATASHKVAPPPSPCALPPFQRHVTLSVAAGPANLEEARP